MPSEELAFGEDAPLFAVMSTMRAMRRLKPDPVPRELLEKIVEAGTWAPSGGNVQRYSFVVVDDRAQIERLAPLWQRIQRMYVDTFGQIPTSTMDAAQHQKLRDALVFQAEHFAETPALIIACYDVRETVSGLLKRLPQVTQSVNEHFGPRLSASYLRNMAGFAGRSESASIYPAVQNMLLAARALGLGATLTTWHLALEGEFKAILQIPKNTKTFALLPIGYPRGNFGPVRRRSTAEAIHWNRW